MASEIRNVVRWAQLRLAGAAAARESASAATLFAGFTLAGVLLQRFTQAPLFGWFAAIGALLALGVLAYRFRLPRPLAAAAELDRQFELKESISTAWQIDPADADSFRVAAKARGEELAKQIETRELNPGGWGQWKWVAALVMLGLAPALYRPVTTEYERRAAGTVPTEDRAVQTAISKPTPQKDPRIQSPAPTGESAAGVIPLEMAKDDGDTGRPAPRASQGETAGESAGGGFAQGYAPPNSPRPLASVRLPRSRSASTSDGDMAGGGAGRSAAATGISDAAGTVASAQDVTTKAAGSGDSAGANGSSDLGEIPAAYRDIVKAYYRR